MNAEIGRLADEKLNVILYNHCYMHTPPRQSDFPHQGTPAQQLEFLLGYAVLAPSTHNTQPWLWQIEGEEATLRADFSRAMPALDPQGRELIMSCGAALHHLCVAIRAFDFAALTSLFPNPNQPDLLARVRLGAPRPATPHDDLLFDCLTKRHTHRGEFESRPLAPNLLRALSDEAEGEEAFLHFAQTTEDRRSIAELIERGDVEQNRDSALRRDVADWIAPPGERRDGIPTSALGIPDWRAAAAPLAQRVFDMGEATAQKDVALAMNAPVLAVLSSSGDDVKSWLSAGRALSRVLLRARTQNVWASFFSQPVQVDGAWRELRHMIGLPHFPQLVFRLGYGSPVPATPRRSVEDVAQIIEESEALNR